MAIANLMEDTATAEISRAQLWQWIQRGARLADGRTVDAGLYRTVRDHELARLEAGGKGHLRTAAEILDELVLAADFLPSLTLRAYPSLD